MCIMFFFNVICKGIEWEKKKEKKKKRRIQGDIMSGKIDEVKGFFFFFFDKKVNFSLNMKDPICHICSIHL